MTNWFKTKNENVVEEPTILQKEEKIITSKDIQADLHKSFEDVIKDFGLKESKETEILKLKDKLDAFKNENIEVYNKIETLQNLGLTSTPSVVKSLQTLKYREAEINEEVKKINEEIREAEKLKNLVSEYSLKYPFYKFIDDKTMLNIMTKYDLYLGDAFIYSKEIPDENLSIISSFSTEIKESEKTFNLIETRHGRFNYYEIERGVMREQITEKGIWLRDPFNYKQVLQSYKVSKLKIIAPQSHFSPPTFKYYDTLRGNTDVPIMKIDEGSRKFVFSTVELNELEAEKRKVLDPIACLEVEGGFIVLTAWDEEAEIPEIQNTFLN